MAQHGKASATLVAEVDQYVRAISSLPGITDKEIRQAATKYSAHLQKMEAANAKFAKSTAASTDKSIESIQDVTDVVAKLPAVFNGSFGDVLGPVGDLGDLLGMIGPAGAVATVALGALAVSGAAVLTSSIDLISTLPENIGLFRQNAYAAEQARAAMESLESDTMALRVEMAGQLAPAIRDAADVLHGMVVAADEAHRTLPDVSVDILDVADSMFVLGGALPGTLGALADAGHLAIGTAEGFRELGRARREAADEMTRGSESDQVSLQHQIDMAAALGLVATAQEGAAYHAAQAHEAERAAQEARRKAEHDRAEALRAAEAAAQELARQTKSLMDIEYEASLRLMSTEDQIYERRDRQLVQIYDLALATGEYAVAQRAAEAVQADALNQVSRLRAADRAREEAEGIRQATDAVGEMQAGIGAAFAALGADIGESATVAGQGANAMIAHIERIQEAERQHQLSVAGSILGSTQTLFNGLANMVQAHAAAVTSAYGAQSEEARKAEMRAWEISQTSAYAQAVLSLPVAVAQAWELPYPANIAAIAAATVGVGAQILAISTASPPALHSGGLADERDYRLKQGELVVSAPQVDRAGGVGNLRAKLDAPQSQGPISVMLDFGDARLVQHLRQQLTRGSPDPWLGVSR